MPRVVGIDPGTVSIDLCGLDGGRVFLDQSLPTADALADPSPLLELLADQHRAAPLDLVAGPSGYGLPLIPAREVTANQLRLAYLAAEGEPGGIGGLGTLIRRIARMRPAVPVVLTPGVIHLASVPPHRKVNRVDMGTADKVCACALAVREEAGRRRCHERDVSLILLELGGAFTAALAVEEGQIVDGCGGTSGPLGARAAGALDGEVAFLAGTMTKEALFRGGVATIAGVPDASVESVLAAPGTPREALARAAYLESVVKSAAALLVAAPRADVVVLSGRLAHVGGVADEIARRLGELRAAGRLPPLMVRTLAGFTPVAKAAAQGAALIADGLAGGRASTLVGALGLRAAAGSALDHLYVVSPDAARARLGIT